jgi:hypothetical protein
LEPVINDANVFDPILIFLDPVVHAANPLLPMAVFPEPVLAAKVLLPNARHDVPPIEPEVKFTYEAPVFVVEGIIILQKKIIL